MCCNKCKDTKITIPVGPQGPQGPSGTPCTLSVALTPVAPTVTLEFTADVTGGTAPFTYNWEFKDYNMQFNITEPIPSAPQYVVLTSDGDNEPALGIDGYNLRTCLLKVTVTDANGCTATDFYFVTKLTGKEG
jgi:hypothetical protein